MSGQSSIQETNIEVYPLEDRGLAEGGYKKVRNKSKSLAELSRKKYGRGDGMAET